MSCLGVVSRFRVPRLCLVAALVLVAPRAWAQRDTSSIVGTVRDASGGVIPNATVTVTNTATNIAVKVSSDPSGDYIVTPLRVGTYSLKAEARGFTAQVFEAVSLDVDQHRRVDFELPVGTAQQQVTVTAAPPLS